MSVHSFWKIFLTAYLIVFAIALSKSHAQTAEDRAGEIKLWREKCNDPDIDLRTAYVEEAITSKGAIVKRICVRQALESNVADIRNLGIRAAIAAKRELTFEVEYPVWLKKAYDKAGDDQEKRREVNNYFQAKDIRYIKNGITFVIEDASVTSSSSTWFPLADLSKPHSSYKGRAIITGDGINWNGEIRLASGSKCSLSVRVIPDAKLVGKLGCGNRGEYNVTARLL